MDISCAVSPSEWSYFLGSIEHGVPSYVRGCKGSGTEINGDVEAEICSYVHFLPRKIICDLCRKFGKHNKTREK